MSKLDVDDTVFLTHYTTNYYLARKCSKFLGKRVFGYGKKTGVSRYRWAFDGTYKKEVEALDKEYNCNLSLYRVAITDHERINKILGNHQLRGYRTNKYRTSCLSEHAQVSETGVTILRGTVHTLFFGTRWYSVFSHDAILCLSLSDNLAERLRKKSYLKVIPA